MKLFNSVTHQKEDFVHEKNTALTLYTCGPTVYNFAHIGNLRTFIFYDVLRRALTAHGWDVNHVMNITDVGHLTDDNDAGDDKMEKGAAREGLSVWEIAQRYTDAFLEDSRALNLLEPTEQPKATDHIDEQIALVKQLEHNGHTYTISDGVYYDTSTFPEYGKMAQLDFDGMKEGARVDSNPEKRHATDFALWKFSPEDRSRAMEWESPWGTGFPGWHVECSAMAMAFFGDTMDIHAGGVDHLPVHHTNEIAQSEGATGKPFARVWLHGEFLLMNEGKMSKSDGTFVTLADMTQRGIDPLAYRYFVLGAHYRSKLNFTWQALEGAQKTLNKLVSMAAQWDVPKKNDALTPLLDRFFAAINDDLNTPQALASVWELVKSTHPSSQKMATLLEMDTVLGLHLEKRIETLKKKISSAGDDVYALLEQRDAARARKDFETADALREQIAELGFSVEDSTTGSTLTI
jgi:cysteinyl-tRNA synthetase